MDKLHRTYIDYYGEPIRPLAEFTSPTHLRPLVHGASGRRVREDVGCLEGVA